MPFLENKTILVTGGTGSFGKKFTEIVLRDHKPKVIRIFSRDELKQFEMEQRFKDDRLRFFVGDIRDRDRVLRAMHGADIVIHAAALKQVPSCEYNPFEAIKTNIFGSQNIIEAAIDSEVEKVIFLSSDKAVDPVSLYGATKLCGEKLFIQGNVYVGDRRTKISVVRYGNFIGSRGSVVPVFKSQKEKGVLTLTDERMTRFWLTKKLAVNFLIYFIEIMRGGEIFIPKIPSMKVIDLARAIAPEAKIEKIGIRPGEKINEVLLSTDDVGHSKEFDKYFVIEPEYPFWGKADFGGKIIPEGFRYSSNDNDWWLGEEEIKNMMENL